MALPVKRLTGWVRRHPVLVALVLADLALRLLLFPMMAHDPFQGDEGAYADSARALSNAVRDLVSLQPLDLGEIKTSVVGNGWFMPGTSTLLTPLYLVAPHAALTAVRVYFGVFTTLLLFASALAVGRLLGKAYGYALLVFPGLLPMWVVFSFTAWGDLSAGLVVVVLLAFAVRLAVDLRRGTAPTVGQGVLLGLLCTVILYLRSSALPLVAGVFALALVAILLLLTGPRRRRGVAFLGVAVAVFAAVLAPWSVAASKTLGAPVLTTTTVPISLAFTFGDRDKMCFGPCDAGKNGWFGAVRYSRQLARLTGTSELDVQKQMSAYALSDLTPHSYAEDVAGDFGRYLLRPTVFEKKFRPVQHRPDSVSRLIIVSTSLVYFGFLAVAAAAILMVVRSSFRAQVLSTLLKLFAGALLLQPFVHVSSGRYWPVLAPLMAVSAVLLLETVRDRRRRGGAVAEPGSDSALAATRPLVWVQACLSGAFVLVAVALAVLAWP